MPLSLEYLCGFRLGEYEENKKAEDLAIKVGDEVTDGHYFGVATRVESKEQRLYVVMKDGSAGKWPLNGGGWRKTGKFFPQIEEVLKKIGEEV